MNMSLKSLFFVVQRNEGCQCMQFTSYDVGINMLSSRKNEGSRPLEKNTEKQSLIVHTFSLSATQINVVKVNVI